MKKQKRKKKRKFDLSLPIYQQKQRNIIKKEDFKEKTQKIEKVIKIIKKPENIDKTLMNSLKAETIENESKMKTMKKHKSLNDFSSQNKRLKVYHGVKVIEEEKVSKTA